MKIGIGLPNPVLDTTGEQLVDWARRAEEHGFSTLATIDRIAYPSYDSLTALTAAAAVTQRIGLFTNILLAPAYDVVHLARVSASVDRISGGRLTLGFGVGSRKDDFDATGKTFADRGKRYDAQLEALHAAWAGEPVAGSPFPVGPGTTRGRIPILFGGEPERAARRAVRWDAGYTIGGAPPEMAADMAERFRTTWRERSGSGEPRVVVLSYFSLEEENVEESLQNLRTYYGHLADWVEGIAQGAPRTPDAILERVRAFEAIGVDELILDPTVADPKQVDLLADVVL